MNGQNDRKRFISTSFQPRRNIMTRHIIFMTFGFLLSSALTLWGQFQGSGNAGITTASAAQEAVDDAWVTLSGTILRPLEDDRYHFQDATGIITVEIDAEHWGNVTAPPKTIFRIAGEVDRVWMTTEIDVEQVEPGNASSRRFKQVQQKHQKLNKPIDRVQSSQYRDGRFPVPSHYHLH